MECHTPDFSLANPGTFSHLMNGRVLCFFLFFLTLIFKLNKVNLKILCCMSRFNVFIHCVWQSSCFSISYWKNFLALAFSFVKDHIMIYIHHGYVGWFQDSLFPSFYLFDPLFANIIFLILKLHSAFWNRVLLCNTSFLFPWCFCHYEFFGSLCNLHIQFVDVHKTTPGNFYLECTEFIDQGEN